VVARRPQAPVVGAALGFLAVAVAHVVAREIGFQVLARHDDPQQWSWLVAVLTQSADLVLVAVALLLLFFPDGGLPGPRWRWVPAALVVCALADMAYGAVDPMDFRAPLEELPHPWPAPPEWVSAVSLVTFVGLLVLTLACAAALVLRFRRSARLQRQQIKWLALAGLGVPLYPLLCLVEILAWGRPLWVSGAVGVAALVGIPVATGVAVLRHDLYDVDKAIATTATWGVLTVALVAVYAVTSSWAGLLLGRESAVVAAVGTATCAVLLSPLRRRLQHVVDRRLYPLRGAALGAIDTLQRDVSHGTASPEELEARLRVALRDPGLRIGYRLPGAQGYVDALRQEVDPARGVVVRLEEQPTGVLVPGGEVAEELLGDVGTACTTLVEVVRLRLEVADALREAESSRARLVETGYRERRRLERDLHDGAQQRLVSLGMSLRLAQRHLTDGTVDLDALFDESVAELGTAVAELRQLAHGLRPSSLDDGLPAALSNLVRSLPLTVDMEVDAGPLPDAVATTAYYVISEAVANAVKHSGATRIELRVERRDDTVEVVVSDDGCGGASLGAGSGLSDRVAALGGSLDVLSPPGRGTVVRAALPFETPRARVVGASSLGRDDTAPSPQGPPCAS
jgi:signal transduction histidine kinase